MPRNLTRSQSLLVILLVLLSSLSLQLKAQPQSLPGQSLENVVININEADVETLSMQLEGIGETRARAIVEYRELHGPYVSLDELLEVQGIGEATLERNRARMRLE